MAGLLRNLARRRAGATSERGILIWLRWLMALTLLLLLVASPPSELMSLVVRVAVLAAIVAINIVFSRSDETRLGRWSTHPLVFLLDFSLMTIAILFVPGMAEGVHLLYFFAILIGASVAGLANALLIMAVVAAGYFAYKTGLGDAAAFLTPQYLLCGPFLLIVVCLVNFISERSRRLRAALAQKDSDLARTTGRLHEKEREFLACRLRSDMELQQANRRLAELNEYNRCILQSVSTGIVITDLDCTVTTCNRYAARVLEIDPDGLLGRPLSVLSRAPAFDRIVRRGLSLRAPQERHEICVQSEAGDTLSLGISVSLLKDGDARMIGAIAFFQNITPIKAMRSALARSDKLAALGRLSADVAHEVRNPLNAIRGLNQLIREGTAQCDDIHKYADTVIGEVDRLSKFLSNVLEFARIGAPRRVWIDLAALVDETLVLARPRVEESRINVVNECVHPVQCSVDPETMKQVFLNIVLNAVDAMSEGGTLRASCTGDRDPAFVKVRFEDTGCGLSQGELRSIFDPFFTLKPQGSGLGLSVSHQIVEAHGGRIDVESSPGVGTVFTVCLPVRPTVVEPGKRDVSTAFHAIEKERETATTTDGRSHRK